MRKTQLLLVLLALAATAHAQTPKTIEGFWQDTARRILFVRDAPASYVYGQWTKLDQAQTYPTAKHIVRSGTTFKLVDLLYDNEHSIRIVNARDDGIEFVRSTATPACGMYHKCRLQGDEMFCSLENICREGGKDVLVWKGEERYARRAHCEQGPRREAQGIPHRCW